VAEIAQRDPLKIQDERKGDVSHRNRPKDLPRFAGQRLSKTIDGKDCKQIDETRREAKNAESLRRGRTSNSAEADNKP
jgi:hypothetical protein